jgi:hypothetical protein
MDTIKTLVFDLAAVVSSIEGRGDHPRFLIHDGPREGNMARVIYGRFFLYAVELEATFPSADEASGTSTTRSTNTSFAENRLM